MGRVRVRHCWGHSILQTPALVRKDDFLLRLVTVDETWVHYYEPENKVQSRQWVGSESGSVGGIAFYKHQL